MTRKSVVRAFLFGLFVGAAVLGAMLARGQEAPGTAEAAPPTTGFYVTTDCNLTISGVQDGCQYPTGTTNINVGVVLVNIDVNGEDLGAFNAAIAGTWACSPPPPNPDSNADPSIATSFLSCFYSGGPIQTVPAGT